MNAAESRGSTRSDIFAPPQPSFTDSMGASPAKCLARNRTLKALICEIKIVPLMYRIKESACVSELLRRMFGLCDHCRSLCVTRIWKRGTWLLQSIFRLDTRNASPLAHSHIFEQEGVVRCPGHPSYAPNHCHIHVVALLHTLARMCFFSFHPQLQFAQEAEETLAIDRM